MSIVLLVILIQLLMLRIFGVGSCGLSVSLHIFIEIVKASSQEVALTTKLQKACACLSFLLKFSHCQFRNVKAVQLIRQQERFTCGLSVFTRLGH